MKRAFLICAMALPVPAHSAIIALADLGQDAVVEIHDEPGIACTGVARAAFYTQKADRIAGCWKFKYGQIYINWLDGDRDELNINLLRRPSGA